MVGCGSNDGYVDLGLPSGTKWKKTNAGGSFDEYRWDEAVDLFGDKLPSKAQWEELARECKWKWVNGNCTSKNGYKVIGPNGKSVFLPAWGMRLNGEQKKGFGCSCCYWSSSRCSDYPCTKFGSIPSFEAYSFYFIYDCENGILSRYVSDSCYVRLVTK